MPQYLRLKNQDIMETEAMNKFKLMLLLTRKVKAGYFKNKNELETWMIDNKFSFMERAQLKWMEYAI